MSKSSLVVLNPAETAACCPPLAAEPLSAEQAELVAALLKALGDPGGADVAGGLPSGRRGLRLRPERGIRPDPADDQPSPEGLARGGPAGPGEARRVGLLPGPSRGTGQ